VSLTARGLAARCRVSLTKKAAALSEPIAVATRFGRFLNLPEHPHKGDTQTDDDAQKHERQGWGCEHGEHP
jgi:hypothetical protein